MALMDEARRRGLIDQIPTSGMRAPAADGSQNNPLNTDLGRNVTNTLGALPGAGAVPGVAAAAGGLAARALGAATPAATAVGRVAQTAAPYAPVAGGAAALHSAAGASSPAAPAAPPATSLAGQPAAGGVRALPGSLAASPAPAPGASAPATPDNQVMPGVFNHGRGQYSDQAGGMGTPSSFTGQPNAQNLAAAEALSQRGAQAALAQPPRSMMEAAGITAPTVRHSGNDWQSRNDLRNAQVSASSITNDGGRWDQHKGVSAARAYAAGLEQADTQARFAQPAFDMKTAQENANTQREGMQQQGANQRSLWQYALDQQRINQQGEAQGYTNRTNRLVEAARNQVAAEQDPTKRRSLVQYMRDIEGRAEPADPYLVVPGGQQIDPTSQRAYNTPASVFNRQTGQFVQQPQGQGGVSPIGENQQAIAIRDNPNLSREQKVEALRKLGYS